MLTMVAILAIDIAIPMPAVKKTNQAGKKAVNLAIKTVDVLRKDTAEKRAEIDSRIWKGSSDSVSSQTLDKASTMAKTHGLHLTAFRPQKPDEQGELTRLVYVMTLEGPYPGLQAMVRELETPENRLSVHMVQVASSDEASDLVTATVGVSAFIEKTKPNSTNTQGQNKKV
jgi:hypothetical protein